MSTRSSRRYAGGGWARGGAIAAALGVGAACGCGAADPDKAPASPGGVIYGPDASSASSPDATGGDAGGADGARDIAQPDHQPADSRSDLPESLPGTEAGDAPGDVADAADSADAAADAAADAGDAALPSTLVNPETDLVYLGAFRVPDEHSGGTNWGYSPHGMSYRPGGDPGGPADGFPGSLFAIGHPWHNLVSEFDIPAPKISPSKKVQDLPVAKTLQPFKDVTGGKQTGGLEGFTLGDIQYFPKQPGQTTDKLHWVMWVYYLPEPDDTSFGWSELDWAHLDPHGTWRLGGFPFAGTSKYLFEIPAPWAKLHTPGKLLAAGRFRVQNQGSFGPSLFAYGPWNDAAGAPPANGASLAAVRLLYYPDLDHKPRDWSSADNWDDGVWLTLGGKAAVVFTGTKALRTWDSDLQYYGNPDPDQCGSHGYHAAPYYGCMLFYDPSDLAAVASGASKPYTPQPYAMFNLDDIAFNRGCDPDKFGAAGFDRERGLLYMAEKKVEGEFDKRPIIHVWRLTDQGKPPDAKPPTVPSNLHLVKAAYDRVELAWDASSDDVRLVGYVVFRYGEPVGTTLEPRYTDDKVNPNGVYEYTVEAWDAVSRTSAPSATLGVTTPAGTDSRIPLVHLVRVTDITPTSAVIRWITDELATTEIRYGVEYGGGWKTVQDPALTRQHTHAATGLVAHSHYEFYITARDAKGNVHEVHREFFSTP